MTLILMMMTSDDLLFVPLNYRIGFVPENYCVDSRE